MTVEIVAVTPDRLDDLAELFATHAGTNGCWCMAFVVSRPVLHAGWRDGGNRTSFAELTREEGPLGMLAYSDGVPAGWCSVGPRSRYGVAQSPRSILRGRDPAEDDDVWLVPCFFVRVGFRRAGLSAELLDAAVDHAARNGAKAIEGWPIADTYLAAETFEGREHVFAKCGFTCVARPSPRRAIMRKELASDWCRGRASSSRRCST